MSNKNKNRFQNNHPQRPSAPVVEQPQEAKPTVEKGNYIIQVLSDGQEIKRIAVANAEINIVKLAEGGLAIDLK